MIEIQRRRSRVLSAPQNTYHRMVCLLLLFENFKLRSKFWQEKIIDLVEELKVTTRDNRAIMFSLLDTLEERVENKLSILKEEVQSKLGEKKAV